MRPRYAAILAGLGYLAYIALMVALVFHVDELLTCPTRAYWSGWPHPGFRCLPAFVWRELVEGPDWPDGWEPK